jgi:hypothetical protein
MENRKEATCMRTVMTRSEAFEAYSAFRPSVVVPPTRQISLKVQFGNQVACFIDYFTLHEVFP